MPAAAWAPAAVPLRPASGLVPSPGRRYTPAARGNPGRRFQGGNTMAQHTRPFIGINADFVVPAKAAGGQARLSAGYFDTVCTAGGLPVVLPPLNREAELDDLLGRLDG